MRILSGDEEKIARRHFEEALSAAQKATCERAKCGSVIVKDGNVIGRGYNSPPHDSEEERRCQNEKNRYDPKVTDKTCCMHAEVRAIMDALAKNPQRLKGAKLYFIRLGTEGKPGFSGEPYCTICSKMALDSGISEFLLWKKEGIAAYPTDEYNTLSYRFQSE